LSSHRLNVVDISDPEQPVVLGGAYRGLPLELLPRHGSVTALNRVESIPYPKQMVGYCVEVLDTAGPGDPQLVIRDLYLEEWWPWADDTSDIAMAYPYVFFSIGRKAELFVFNITDLLESTSVGLPHPTGLAISGPLLLAADELAGLVVLDHSCLTAVFQDDLETGDLDRWSASVP
jgi:hypothetical protein